MHTNTLYHIILLEYDSQQISGLIHSGCDLVVMSTDQSGVTPHSQIVQDKINSGGQQDLDLTQKPSRAPQGSLLLSHFTRNFVNSYCKSGERLLKMSNEWEFQTTHLEKRTDLYLEDAAVCLRQKTLMIISSTFGK